MDPMQLQKYVYKQFAPIRLLHVQRDRDGRVHGSLENFNLYDQRCPKFLTLSYVWGTPHRTKTIQIDGMPFPVLDNVFPILEAVCDYPCFRNDHWVWIDSICINQEDEHERAQQVQLMGRIYRQSTRTVIWLGKGTIQTDRVIEFLHDLVAALNNNDLPLELPDAASRPATWADVDEFFHLPWWTRVWTLQEFVLPETLDLHCGEKKIEGLVFQDAMQALYYCHRHGIGDSSSWGTAWGRRRVRTIFMAPHLKNRVSLVALLAYTGNYDCVDPRDRVYSLLGLAREQDRAIVGLPNYNHRNTIEAVYTNIVINFIQVCNSLDVICFAPLFSGRTTSEDSELPGWPSWLPDWRAKVRPQVVPLMVSQPGRSHISCFRPLPWPETEDEASLSVFSAGGSTEPVLHLNVSAKTLACKGVYVDNIDGIATRLFDVDGGAYTQCQFVPSTSPNNTEGTDQPLGAAGGDLAANIVRTLTIDRSSRYLEQVAPVARLRAELRHLALGKSTTAQDMAKSTTASAMQWIEHNAKLMVCGRTLLDVCHSILPESYLEDYETLPLAERLLETIGTGNNSINKILATLCNGNPALVPVGSRKGDAIWVLQGCSVPLVLRKNPTEDKHDLVGECYVHNFMNGEAFGKDATVEEVVIG